MRTLDTIKREQLVAQAEELRKKQDAASAALKAALAMPVPQPPTPEPVSPTPVVTPAPVTDPAPEPAPKVTPTVVEESIPAPAAVTPKAPPVIVAEPAPAEKAAEVVEATPLKVPPTTAEAAPKEARKAPEVETLEAIEARILAHIQETSSGKKIILPELKFLIQEATTSLLVVGAKVAYKGETYEVVEAPTPSNNEKFKLKADNKTFKVTLAEIKAALKKKEAAVTAKKEEIPTSKKEIAREVRENKEIGNFILAFNFAKTIEIVKAEAQKEYSKKQKVASKGEGVAETTDNPEDLEILKNLSPAEQAEYRALKARIETRGVVIAEIRKEVAEIRAEIMGNQVTGKTEAGKEAAAEKKKVFGDSYSIASETHPERNEDACFIDNENGAYGIFDGMGGHAAGDIASTAVKSYMEKNLPEITDGMSPEEARKKLREILNEADQKVKRVGIGYKMDEKPGTTASIVKIFTTEGRRYALIGNVGDSRVYIQYHDGELLQFTIDESGIPRAVASKVSEATSKDQLSDEEFIYFKGRHRISNALDGAYKINEDGIMCINVEQLQKIIITSDGIHDNLTNKEIEVALLGGASAKTLTDLAVRRSQEKSFRSKPDDMTAIIINL
jgi:serine/threonine protein phosphatase PrpC